MRQVDPSRALPTKAEHGTHRIVDEELARANARIRDLEAALDAAHRKLGGEGDELAAPTRDALARSEQRFRALIDDLHLGVVVQGPHSEILLHNERALELLGLSEDEMLGRSSFHPSWQVIREDGTPYLPEERPVATVLATRSAVRGVVMGIHRPRTSDLVWLLVTAKPEFNAAGEIVQVVSTLDDISERKQLETSLRQTQKLESLGLLAGGIAHDFNNLLSVITSCTELAHYQVAADSEVARELDEVLVAAERATSLTRQLLSFARRQVVSPRRLDLNELLAGQFEKLLARLLGEHHRLVIERDELPALVRLDQGQLEQVFVNLVVNARDAMPKGGQITITIDQLVVGQAPAPLSERPVVRVVVRDQGTGIPPEIKERLFEPFFTTKPVGRGTGLGLATVHGIVQQSNGLIEVRSEFGQGSEFHVLLPAEQGAVEASGESGELGARVGRGQLVLVVDDEPVLRSVTSRMLVTLGYRTLEAGDGFDALDVLEPRAADIDLVFSDVVMPRMGGVELAHRIRKHWPAMRIVLTSGYAQVAIEDDEAGIADAMLPKPFNASSLARVIREVMSLA